MSNRLDTTSTVTLVINGEQSKTSLRDITTALNAVRAARARMNQEEDPARYQELIRQEQALAAAQRARRNEVLATTNAIEDQTEKQKGFFADFKKGFSEISEMAGNITAGTLIYKAVGSVIEEFKSVISGSEEAFKEADLTQTALQNKLRQTGNAAGENIKKLQDLQKAEMDLTGVDDDVIAKGEDMLLTFTNVRGKIYEQSIPAIVDYAAAMNNGKVTMEGIQSAAETLGKGLDDLTKIKKTAKAMDVTLTEEEYNQIEAHRKNNEVMAGQQIFIDALTKRYGDLGKTLSETDTGGLQRFETRLGNIQEVIGQWIVKGKALWASVLNPFLGFVEDVVSSKLSDTLEDERLKMNELVLEITDANTKQDERVKLINKLKEMYPDYLKDLDSEKTSNEKMVEIGEKLNDVYINRIILAKKDQEIESQNQTTADLKMKRLEAERTMRQELAKLHDKLPELKVPTDGTTYEKLSAMLSQYEKSMNAAHRTTGGIFDPAFSAGRALNEYKALLEFAKNAENQGNAMLKARAQLIKDLGIDEKFNGATPEGGNKPPENPVGGETDAERDARLKAAEAKKKAQDEAEAMSKEFSEKIIQFNADVFADTLDKNDKEIKATENKFNALITTQQAALEKYKANKYANDNEVKKHEEEIRQLGISRDAAVAQIKVRQAQELEDKIEQLRDRAGVNLKNDYQKEVDTINDQFDQLSKDAGDNQDAQNRIYYERVAALADARIRLEKSYRTKSSGLKTRAQQLMKTKRRLSSKKSTSNMISSLMN
ncbi:hypothetical protein ACRQ5D_10940 [Mucilaginibacter sp. P25]|uniref:hypothetical protein n=1 Tax=Mucilaginibacter sp. P25 TaxID=3423945 RepID=UPI003D799976